MRFCFPNMVALGALATVVAAEPGGIQFNRDVRPILSDRCFACHGPDSANRKSTLRLDRAEGGRRGAEIYRRITTDNKALRMPPAYAGHDKLPAREIEILGKWIEQGAPYEPHWSLIAPSRPALPDVRDMKWVRNPIDRFVLARLEREGLRPSPEADGGTLRRRAALDITGLPPPPGELETMDYEAAVDRLLASPRYAERMAIRWLEAARYADTNGYQSDGPRDMWRWRDWVIDAFNRNLPFDRFTVEQIAGDLLPGATLDQKIATAFHRNHRTSAEGGIVDEEFRVEYVADRVETTGTVWLGMTVGCARCHDHKYDPITQKEFYELFAFFNNVPEKGFVFNFGNEEPFIKAPRPEEEIELERLDARVAELERKLERMKPAFEKAQRAWEKRQRRDPAGTWTITSGQTYRAGLDGVHFDGKHFVEAEKDVAKFNFRDPFTFAAWIKPQSANGAILSRAEDYFEGEGHSLHVLNGKLRLHVTFRWTDLGLRVETTEPLAMNEWQHVAAVYDGSMKASGVRLYVNGRERKLKVLFDQLIWPINPKAEFRIGAGGGLRFEGWIEDVRVLKRAISPEEAAVLVDRSSIEEIAGVPSKKRSAAQREKLRMCFTEKFSPPEYRKRIEELAVARTARDKFYAGVPTVMSMVERERARETFLLKRGAYDAPGERVIAGVPAALSPFRPEWPRNRLGLARWLVDRGNPLTARVAVNRTWQMLFGTGLVKTSEDFGSQGEVPLHAELLDWLAVDFMENGWDLKRLIRTIVTSSTYRQSSRITPELLQRDPENRLLARGARYRLPAEMIRDQALAVSGLLVEKIGGPSVKPYQPPGLWQELAGGQNYQPDKGEGLYRRSLYTYWRRTIAPPGMINFDSPTRETCAVRTPRTNTPLQALNLMNDVIYVEAARNLASRALRQEPDAPLERMFRLVLARGPSSRERFELDAAMRKFAGYFSTREKEAADFLSAGESPRDASIPAVRMASWTAVAGVILNMDETITRE